MEEDLMLCVEKQWKRIGEAFDFLWKNPETGYKEWKSHTYLIEAFAALGYRVQSAGNIPGFIADIDTGLPGPTVAVFGELDGLICPNHPDADPQTGAVHSCGHCAQGAALLGLAAALKEPGALAGMSGKIRFVAVPAEELIEVGYREQLRKQGIIRYFGGKPEFLSRGLLDGVDLSFMIHTSSMMPATAGKVAYGSNGCVTKRAEFHGHSAHAGSQPHNGINALYAANQAMSAINALRETFRDDDHIRVHPIITMGGESVNAIPDKVVLECYVRAADGKSMKLVNDRVNRAMAASAAALGATLTIDDKHGYFPRIHDRGMMLVAKEAMDEVLERTIYDENGWGTGCSDMGDMSMLMPTCHPFVGGARGVAHGNDYVFDDGQLACMNAAKVQAQMLWLLLSDGAARAKEILEDFKPVFPDKASYFAHVDAMTACWEAVTYGENGTVCLTTQAPKANDNT